MYTAIRPTTYHGQACYRVVCNRDGRTDRVTVSRLDQALTLRDLYRTGVPRIAIVAFLSAILARN